MHIERFFLTCLAHASYILHDSGEAAVIDPQRDIDLYLEYAAAHNLTIRWVIETHLHADFVSGHLELARRTGASICISAAAAAIYPHRALNDGETISIGHAQLLVLATPGHTEESISLLASPSPSSRPEAVFTGDTLFIGDVGRPDLSPLHTPQQLAAMLYDSLHSKLLTLPPETIIYPAHGAGSLCGRGMSSDASSTIARERQTNYALQPMSRDQFVAMMTIDLPERPAYFEDEVERNRTGAVSLEDLPPLPRLTPAQVQSLQATGVILLDTRPALDFAVAHIPGSLHIALAGQFASWAARLIGIRSSPVVLIAEDEDAIQESRLRLARVGLENIAGALDGGIHAWTDGGLPVQSTDQITATDLAAHPSAPHLILDVRDPAERAEGFIPGSIPIPLPELSTRLAELDPSATIVVHCKGGYRSSIATSLLQSANFPHILNLIGGYDAWSFTQSRPIARD